MLYAFNQSHFDCMYATWYANLKKIYRKKLQVLQNKCIRFSLQWNNREQIGMNIDMINWLPIDQRFIQFLFTSILKFFSEMCLQHMKGIY